MAPKLFSKQISRMDDGFLKKFCISMCFYKNSFSLVSWIQTKMSKLGFGQNNKQYGLMKLVFALSFATLVGIALFARFLGTSSSSISFTYQSIASLNRAVEKSADNNVASDNHTNQDHQVIHWSFSSSSFLFLLNSIQCVWLSTGILILFDLMMFVIDIERSLFSFSFRKKVLKVKMAM